MSFWQELLNPYNLQICMAIVINALLALSLWLPISAGQLSLGSAGFMSVGAYTAALLSLNAGWPIYVNVLAGALAGAIIAFFLGYPVLRLHGVYLAIATLGFGEMVRIVVLNLEVTRGALGLAGIPQIVDEIAFWLEISDILDYGETFWGLDNLAWASLIVIAALLLILSLCVYALLRQQRSRVGRALAAIALDEMAARASGIDVARHRLRVFTQSGFLAGLAGGLHAHLNYFIGPSDFGYHRAIDMLLYVVLGGQETIIGPIFGAGLLTILPEALRASPSHRAILYGLCLLAIVIFAPRGLLSEQVLGRAFRGRSHDGFRGGFRRFFQSAARRGEDRRDV